MIYVILFIVAVHSAEGINNSVITRTFEDLTECEITEGDLLTRAINDDTVVGWIMPQECAPVAIPKKA